MKTFIDAIPLLLFALFAAYWSGWDLAMGVPGLVIPSALVATLLVVRGLTRRAGGTP